LERSPTASHSKESAAGAILTKQPRGCSLVSEFVKNTLVQTVLSNQVQATEMTHSGKLLTLFCLHFFLFLIDNLINNFVGATFNCPDNTMGRNTLITLVKKILAHEEKCLILIIFGR